MLQAYDIISCDILYDYNHIPLYHPRNKRNKKENKRKIKLKKTDKKKRKSK